MTGPPGSGKSHLLGQVLAPLEGIVYGSAHLPDADQRQLLWEHAVRWLEPGTSLPRDADWPEILDSLLDEVEHRRRRLTLALDDVHLLVEARSHLPALLHEAWRRIRARGLPVHLVLAGRSPHLALSLGGSRGPLADAVTLHLPVAPLDFREVADLVPGYPPADRIRTYAVFGGLPSRLRHLDPSVTLATNIQKAILARGAPLELEGYASLAADVHSPARYVSILRALASGRTDWKSILGALPGMDSGTRMAPYLARLQELELVRSERSLDAAPRSRRRRYGIVDPFLAFWIHLVLPARARLAPMAASEVWTQSVRLGLEEHTARVFRRVCREYLSRYSAPLLGAHAREVGGLWGREYGLDPAGTLLNGAVVYGLAPWTTRPLDEDTLDTLTRHQRHTRYGFGREGRIRLVFGAGGFTRTLRRRAARDHLVRLVDLDDLLT